MLRFRSIAQTRTKIKALATFIDLKDLFMVFSLILAGFSGYIAGRLEQVYKLRIPLVIERFEPVFPNPSCEPVKAPINTDISETKQGQSAPIKAVEKPQSGLYVGSKSGSKYHLPNCPGALRISVENKVWFTSKEDALAKGYTPASNCKGL